jgi:putative transposase
MVPQLKTELIYINEFGSPKALCRAIRDYIRQYNMVRPHEALDYATPEAEYSRPFVSPDANLDRASLAG